MGLGDSTTESALTAGSGEVPATENELARTQALLRAEQQRLNIANRELETLCYSISHDLRAPLRAIDGFSQALSSDFGHALPAEAQHCIARILKGAERMSAQIDGLLALSRIHDAPLRRTHVDLSELASKISKDLAAQSPARHVDVEIEDGLSADADARLTALLLINLIRNAWKFTGTRAKARIAFGKNPSSGPPGFFLTDNGVGFDMAYAGRLFAPFQRLHKAADFEGLGMGLAIARRITTLHDGQISVAAKPEVGATFSFTLGSVRG